MSLKALLVYDSPEQEELDRFTEHNAPLMRRFLTGFLLLLAVYCVISGMVPSFEPLEHPGLNIATFLLGALLDAVLIKASRPSRLLEGLFIAYLLSFTLLYSYLLRFTWDIVLTYVVMLFLLSVLFYFGRRLLGFIALSQVLFILLLTHTASAISDSPLNLALVTTLFAVLAASLSVQRHQQSRQAHLMERRLLDRSEEITHSNEELQRYAERLQEQVQQTKEARALFESLLASVETAVVLTDRTGKILYSNDGFQVTTGYPAEEIKEDTWSRVIAEASQEAFLKGFWEALDSHRQTHIPDLRLTRADGRVRTLDVRIRPVLLETDTFVLFNGHDITHLLEQQHQTEYLSKMKDAVLSINHRLNEHLTLEEFLEYILDQIRKVIHHADLGCVLLLDDEETLSIAACFGYNRIESRYYRLKLQQTFFYRFCEGKTDECRIINNIQSFISSDFPSILTTDAGTVVRSSLSTPILRNGKLYGLINIDSSEDQVFTQKDIVIMEYLREQVAISLTSHEQHHRSQYLALHDQMTGFYNRWYFWELQDSLIPMWRGTDRQVHVTLCDLDSLKAVNDTFGHAAGDAYILRFSELLRTEFPDPEILIRMGGDEFILITQDLEKPELLARLEKVNALLSEPAFANNHTRIVPRFSFGISSLGVHGDTLEDLLKTADRRMYVYKQRFGRSPDSGQTPS